MTQLELELLEEWMHLYCFAASIDIGSSGGEVQDSSYDGVHRRTGLQTEALDDSILRDSDSYDGMHSDRLPRIRG